MNSSEQLSLSAASGAVVATPLTLLAVDGYWRDYLRSKRLSMWLR